VFRGPRRGSNKGFNPAGLSCQRQGPSQRAYLSTKAKEFCIALLFKKFAISNHQSPAEPGPARQGTHATARRLVPGDRGLSRVMPMISLGLRWLQRRCFSPDRAPSAEPGVCGHCRPPLQTKRGPPPPIRGLVACRRCSALAFSRCSPAGWRAKRVLRFLSPATDAMLPQAPGISSSRSTTGPWWDRPLGIGPHLVVLARPKPGNPAAE